MTAYTRGMSTNEAARTAPTSRPQQPAPAAQRPSASSASSSYLDPASIYHPARLARALGLALALLLGAALLTGGLGHPLTINGLVAPLDGMPATSPERTAEELDRDVASHRPADAHRSPSAPARPLVPAGDTTRPQDLLLPEDTVAPSPLLPATDGGAQPVPASDRTDRTDASPSAADAYSTFAGASVGGTPTRNLSNLSHDVVRAGRPATFPDGTPLLSRPSHRTGLPSTPREASPAPTPATDLLLPSPKSTPKSATLPGIPPLWETSDVPSKA